MSESDATLAAGKSAQRAAADPGISVWVSANAGTGKTRVLVDRIIRLLLDGVAPGRILCLTFTKAAAAEMATRLGARLGAWATLSEDALAAELGDIYGHTPPDQAMVRARRLFAETLDAPGGIGIRTIHSFCESILGRFPLEAGVAPHFSVMDERTAAELLGEARDRLLSRGGETYQAVARLAALVDEDRFSALMRELAARRGALGRVLDYHGGVEGTVAAASRRLGVDPGDTPDRILAAAAREGAFDRQALKAALDGIKQGKTKGDADIARELDRWLAADDAGRIAGSADYRAVFLTQTDQPRSERTFISNAVRASDPATADTLTTEQARIHATVQKIRAASIVEATGALLALGGALLDGYRAIKAERALLDYDDLIGHARALLTAGGGVSWVHYKLDGGLDHILVDEAQDTSPEQWDVVKSLAAEFFAGHGARPGSRTVFAVGDEKQSIYSFQGADPRSFEAGRLHFDQLAHGVGQSVRPIAMHLSFRTVQVVLNLVDEVFATPAAADGITFGGGPLRHVSHRRGQAGLVEMWPSMSKTTEPAAWDAPFDHVSEESPLVRLTERIADTVAGWLETAEMLPSRARPIVPGDVMILVRKRGAFVDEMVRQLKLRGVPVAGADRMVLTGQIAVMDLMALGDFALLPDDDLTLAAVLKSPLVGLDDDDLLGLAYGRTGSLWQALATAARSAGSAPRIRAGHAFLARVLAWADYRPPYEFYARILNGEGGRTALLRRLGPDAGDPIAEFLSLALHFEREHPPSLQGFLHWVRAGATEIKRDLEHGRGEVRVMTVHGAKGLQAPIVFLPDTCSPPDLGGRKPRLCWSDPPPLMLWPASSQDQDETVDAMVEDDKQATLREYRRLLYVAMTRAEDRLYVCGFETKKKRTEGCWYDLIKDALDRQKAEAVEVDGETVLRLASAATAEPDRRAHEAAAADQTPPLPDWALAAPPAEPAPPRPLSPSRGEDEPPTASPLGRDGGARFRRGILTHRLLQTLPELAPERRRAAARRWLDHAAADLDPDARAAIASEVLAVLDHPAARPLFGPGSRAEVPVTGVVQGQDGVPTVISGQIDRLAVLPEAVFVLDYKTNRAPPKSAAEVPPAYVRQMTAYRDLLKDLWPDRPIRCLLLWTDGPCLMEIPDLR